MDIGQETDKRTDAGTNVFYGILLPHGLFGRVESELGEREGRHEAVDVRLQEYPCRLRLNTMEKRVSASRSK